jgi:hypothetical protein
MEANAEQGLVCAAAVEDEVVVCRLLRREVGCFDMGLQNGVEGCEHRV